MLKVSVIVPAYAPGEGLDRVIGSLDVQTMPQDEFEVIIVDDGSPDDTWQRLTTLQQSRPNLRIHRIENSGWPSRPRNVAVDLATGEYVFFMDHDDSLYPDGLRASYAFASLHRADVLNPKELKTSVPTWGVGEYTADVPNAKPERGINSLMPMVPHKFYRREFLQQHHIRFPEGRRKLWEDIYLNVECFKHAEVISILSSTPVYLWHSTEQNNSGSYGPAETTYWDRVEELLAFIIETLPGEEYEPARTTQLVHHYRRRVLGKIANHVATTERGEDWDFALARARQIMERYTPPTLDERLKPLLQVRSALLRAGELELLAQQTRDDRIKPSTVTDDVAWSDGRLRIATTTRWSSPDGEPLALIESDGRLLRTLRPEVARAIGIDTVDLTEEVMNPVAHLIVRRRRDAVTWAVRSEGRPALDELAPAAGPSVGAASRAAGPSVGAASRAVTPTASHDVTMDLSTVAVGEPLDPGVWDLRVSAALAGATGQHLVRTDIAARPLLSDLAAAVAYRTKNGTLALDNSGRLRNIIDDGGLEVPADGPVAIGRRRQQELHLQLPRAAVGGAGARPVSVHWEFLPEEKKSLPLRRRRQDRSCEETGELRASSGTVALALPLPPADGRFDGSLRIDGFDVRSRIRVAMRRGKCESAAVRKE